MPQQICSLCCDKINDFYEFREMCTATNEQTRKLLRLPEISKPNPIIKKIISDDDVADDDGVESIFGVLGGEESDAKLPLTKKTKKGAVAATTSKKAARGKVKKEITVVKENYDGSDTAFSIIISDDELDALPKKRARKKKGDDSNNLSLLLAPKELNERERQREMEQKKSEIENKKKNK